MSLRLEPYQVWHMGRVILMPYDLYAHIIWAIIWAILYGPYDMGDNLILICVYISYGQYNFNGANMVSKRPMSQTVWAVYESYKMSHSEVLWLIFSPKSGSDRQIKTGNRRYPEVSCSMSYFLSGKVSETPNQPSTYCVWLKDC